MQFLVPIFAVGFVFGTVAWIAYLIVDLLRTRQKTNLARDLHGRLIERLAAQDLGPFLTSEDGGRLLRTLSEQPAGAGPHLRILRALQSGLVSLSVGIGLFLYQSARTLPSQAGDAAALFGTLATALGVGLLLAAGASYRMSHRMGLLQTPPEEAGPAHSA